MEAFQIHQDVQDENVIARKFKPAKMCSKNPNRAVLQPLHNLNAVYNLKQYKKQDEAKVIVFILVNLCIIFLFIIVCRGTDTE